MRAIEHDVDFCVVGGGLSGLCAAVAAARRGARVALMQDRPVLGGNASSEIRMWVCGAHGSNVRETGLVEEIQLANLYRNPTGSFSIWDSVLYEKARYQDNLTLLLNCSCCDATMDGSRIASVKGWQTTTETWHTVRAALFADCSGDSILAPLSGAEFRIGREAQSEFDESIEPETADLRTMGMSCLIQARETECAQSFTPPDWAHVYRDDDALPHRGHGLKQTNFWWIELGGEHDSIHDTEELRDELLRVAFGVWDHIKNRGEHDAENYALDWVGFLPGKRESRRYLGDHILTQNDVRAEGRFEDLIAYGGWSMDDHHPAGMHHPGKPTIFHPAPSPFGIPYRSLYSRNVDNLFCAGRNISCTHAAMSATRVMATCGLCGQAAGTAAAIAAASALTPRGVYEHSLGDLKQALMDDDCYLPWNVRAIPSLSGDAQLEASEGDPEPLRNGVDRPVGENDNGWSCKLPGWVQYTLAAPRRVSDMRAVFDSDLNMDGARLKMPCRYDVHDAARVPPATLVRAFRVEVRRPGGGWDTVHHETRNHLRLTRVRLDTDTDAVRFVPESTWGADNAHLFALEVR